LDTFSETSCLPLMLPFSKPNASATSSALRFTYLLCI